MVFPEDPPSGERSAGSDVNQSGQFPLPDLIQRCECGFSSGVAAAFPRFDGAGEQRQFNSRFFRGFERSGDHPLRDRSVRDGADEAEFPVLFLLETTDAQSAVFDGIRHQERNVLRQFIVSKIAVENDARTRQSAQCFQQRFFQPVGGGDQDNALEVLHLRQLPDQSEPVAVPLKPVVLCGKAKLTGIGVQGVFHLPDRSGKIIHAEKNDVCTADRLLFRENLVRRTSGTADDPGSAAADQDSLFFQIVHCSADWRLRSVKTAHQLRDRRHPETSRRFQSLLFQKRFDFIILL